MLEFLQNHWGLIAVIVITICYSLYDFEQFKRKIAALIFVAEERAEEYALQKGSEKFAWVVEHGYQYLPRWMKFFLSEEAFRALVQSIFDGIVKLVAEERKRKRENPIE